MLIDRGSELFLKLTGSTVKFILVETSVRSAQTEDHIKWTQDTIIYETSSARTLRKSFLWSRMATPYFTQSVALSESFLASLHELILKATTPLREIGCAWARKTIAIVPAPPAIH